MTKTLRERPDRLAASQHRAVVSAAKRLPRGKRTQASSGLSGNWSRFRDPPDPLSAGLRGSAAGALRRLARARLAGTPGMARTDRLLLVEIGLMREDLWRMQDHMQALQRQLAGQRAGTPGDAVRLERADEQAARPAVAPQEAAADSAPAQAGLTSARERGQALLARWAREGVLVPSHQLARAWGLTPQALQQASARGELVSVKVAGKRLYPAVFEHLERQGVAAVTHHLQGLADSEQLLFWLRPHGGLRGRTVPEALEAGEQARVLELARAWVDERMGGDGAAPA